MTRQTANSTPHLNPCGLDSLSERQALVVLEGSAKQALETGRTRLLVAGLVFTLAFFVIAVRLVDVSLITGTAEARLAQGPSGPATAGARADILDRNGTILATTLPTASLYANPREVRDPRGAARQLARVLTGVSEAELTAKLDSERAFVWLQRHLTPRQHDAINRLGIPGLDFKRETKRIYPQGALAAHVVGFTDIDNRGLAGIERSFDEVLLGTERPLQLSLDLRVQHILTEELLAAMDEFRAIGAAGLVLDVRSGEVLASVSLPTFDPAQPGRAVTEARFNRTSLGIYEMGSVFKIFTTAMALDEGVVTLADGYDVSKPIRVARYVIRDFKPKNRWLSIPEIFIYSSNIGTVHMAMEAGTPSQRAYLERLGLTHPSGVELPEVGDPLLPSPWREINTMTISYGHGMAVSPLQLASAVATVVNDGERIPATLIKPLPGERPLGERVFSTKTSKAMRWLMRLGVQHGTGRKADAAGFLVGGKTGTADKVTGRRYASDANISSFVGAFPMDAPRYVIFAMVDEPKGHDGTFGYATGGWVAAPAVRRTVERMAPLVGLEPRSGQVAEGLDQGLIPASAKGFTLAAH
ncbi:MAG: penicillin-binding protein 2 [Kiloniellales bacterium]|nr:penicillin-binding protein 2 [Kiloniellales bacterium]